VNVSAWADYQSPRAPGTTGPASAQRPALAGLDGPGRREGDC